MDSEILPAAFRNPITGVVMAINRKLLNREILLGFWKVHILHHAAEGPLVGQWMLHELREHGYHVSPGTLYPLLRRMEKTGWLSLPGGQASRAQGAPGIFPDRRGAGSIG